jgi:uncharacterized protein (DUF1330 family)
LVIVAFESYERAAEWWDSEDYRAAWAIRLDSAAGTDRRRSTRDALWMGRRA